MGAKPGGPIQGAFTAVRPPPRLVDWSIFGIVVFEAISGVVSFTITSSQEWPVFWLHRIFGLTLIVLLGFKLTRVRYRLTERKQWQASTVLSVLTVIAVVGTLATGITWVFGLDVQITYWTLLSVHVGFGLVLIPLMIWHLTTRFRLPSRRDFDRRRTTLKYTALLLGGAVTYRVQELANRSLHTPGADRRVTGSQPRHGTGNGSFPVTSWVADNPDPIDQSDWTLTIRGDVKTPLNYTYSELIPDSNEKALLDCTSGWYTIQQWRGIRVGDLLDTAEVRDEAQFVRFVSVTGYRWSLPLNEAQQALLATHVGDEPLSHGHGAPMRLVAPGRRGFQWVKWIERVDIRCHDDPAQWIVTLISGFD